MSDHTKTEKKDDIWKSWSHLQWFQATGMRYQTNKAAACQGFSNQKKSVAPRLSRIKSKSLFAH